MSPKPLAFPAALRWYGFRLFLAICGATVAYGLFFQGKLGLSIPIFLLLLALLVSSLHPAPSRTPQTFVTVGLLVFALLPLIELPSFPRLLLGLLGLSLFAQRLARPDAWPGPLALLIPLIRTPAGPYLFAVEFIRHGCTLARALSFQSLRPVLASLWLPVGVGGLFLALFSIANPMIERFLEALVPEWSPGAFLTDDVIFWLIALALIWPWLRRFPRHGKTGLLPAWAVPELPTLPHIPEPRVVVSLVLFNLLFAGQNLLDLLYLWIGTALPEGLTYAAYAHRGAYALMAVSLLAAGFILLTTRPDGPMERVRPLRPLLILWVGQCLFLVVSALLRLDLYVEAYTLTHLRLLALGWMGLVGIGFGLILVQILRRKTTLWLIKANGVAAALAIYAGLFIDTGAVIARYNVAHSFEVTLKGPRLDIDYLKTLGPGALTAIERALPEMPLSPARDALAKHRDGLVAQLKTPVSWRAWNFRTWRQQRALGPER